MLEAVVEQDCLPANQKSAKALLAMLLEVPPGTERGSNFLLSAFSYISRKKLAETYPLLWEAVRDVMDRALERHFVASLIADDVVREPRIVDRLGREQGGPPQVHLQQHQAAICGGRSRGGLYDSM